MSPAIWWLMHPLWSDPFDLHPENVTCGLHAGMHKHTKMYLFGFNGPLRCSTMCWQLARVIGYNLQRNVERSKKRPAVMLLQVKVLGPHCSWFRNILKYLLAVVCGISLLAMDFWIPLTINYFAAGGISINNSRLRIADIYEATRNVYEHSPSKDVSQNLP